MTANRTATTHDPDAVRSDNVRRSSAPDNFHTLVVANPQSAGGTLGRRWNRVAGAIEAHFGPFQHRFTSKVGDATRITREALEQGSYEMIVAMGGDGTISEVVDGFFTEQGAVNPNVALGVLHFGTGGDFRRTIQASKKLAEGAAQLRGRQTTSIDVGRMTFTDHDGRSRVRHFINIASFGISGLVDRYVNDSSKMLGGRLTFAISTLRAMRHFNAQTARLTLDDREPIEVQLQTVAVANGQYFGGGMRIAPQAKLDDGQLDIIVLAPLTTTDLLLKGHRVYKGTHLEMPHVSMTRARRLVAEPVTPGDKILLDVDGETPGTLPATFELLPQALLFKTPNAL